MEACEEMKNINIASGLPAVDNSCEDEQREMFKTFHFGTNAKHLYDQSIRICAHYRYRNWLNHEQGDTVKWDGDDPLSLAMAAAAQGRADRKAYRNQLKKEKEAADAARQKEIRQHSSLLRSGLNYLTGRSS